MEEEIIFDSFGKVPIQIGMIRVLNYNKKKRYDSMDAIKEILQCGGNGTRNQIVTDFKKNDIIEEITEEKSYFKKDRHYFRYNQKNTRNLFKDSDWAKLGRELGLGDIFA